MFTKTAWVAAAALVTSGFIGLGRAGGEEGHDDAALLAKLAKSKHTLADGIREARRGRRRLRSR